MNVLVPFRALVDKFPGLLRLNGAPHSLRDDVMALLKIMLASSVVVDDVWYRKRYPDVSNAVDAGEYESTRDHFIQHGYFEGRLPCRLAIDEKWYAETYKDVLIGIEDGDIASAEEHFNLHGYAEGRLPAKL